MMAVFPQSGCIAGPMSYYAIHLKNGTTIHFFGDYHDNMKNRCTGPRVIDIRIFLSRLKAPTVFVEAPPDSPIFWKEPTNMIRETMTACSELHIDCAGVDLRAVHPIVRQVQAMYRTINGTLAEALHRPPAKIKQYREFAATVAALSTPKAVTQVAWLACMSCFPDMPPKLRAWLHEERRSLEENVKGVMQYEQCVATVIGESAKATVSKRLRKAADDIAYFWLHVIAMLMDASVLYNVLKSRSKDIVVVVGAIHANACASFFQTHDSKRVSQVVYRKDPQTARKHVRCVCAKDLTTWVPS